MACARSDGAATAWLGLHRDDNDSSWFLLHLLNRGGALKTVHCRHCHGRYLRDGLNAARNSCPFCNLRKG